MRRTRKAKPQPKESTRFRWFPTGISLLVAFAVVGSTSLANWPSTRPKPADSHGYCPEESTRQESHFSEEAFTNGVGVQSGVWSVDDSVWNLECQSIGLPKLAGEMRFLNEVASGSGSSLPEHTSVIDLVPVQRSVAEQVADCTVRLIDMETIKVGVCYREADGRPFVLGAKVASRQQDDQHWQVITLTPRESLGPACEHLLPIFGNLATTCQRFSKSGDLQFEIIEVAGTVEQQVMNWVSNGWIVDSFSIEDEQGNSSWNCRKGTRFVNVRTSTNQMKSTVSFVLTEPSRVNF